MEDDDLLLPASSSIFGNQVDFDESEPESEHEPEPAAKNGQSEMSGLGLAPVAVSGDESVVPIQETKSTSPSLGAALTLFTISVGGVLGYKYGKWKGATGGVLAAGGVRNLWRAKSQVGSQEISTKASGIQQGIIGLAGFAAGVYLLVDKEG